MKNVIKILFFLLVPPVLLLISATFLLQTKYVQKKIVTWVEKKTEGELSIGTVKMVFPFWVSLTDLHYKALQREIFINHVEATFVPTTLLWGRLTVAQLKINELLYTSLKIPLLNSRLLSPPLFRSIATPSPFNRYCSPNKPPSLFLARELWQRSVMCDVNAPSPI